MTHKLIKTENYLLVVDESEIKKGDLIYCDKFALDSYKHDAVKHIPLPIVTTCFEKYDCDIWFYYDDKKYEAEGGFNTTVFKIIYHLPINNSPILEGVPLLPPLENEVEKLANKWAIDNADITMESNSALNKGFKGGYNKAKEKYKYTEEDLRKAWNAAYIDALAIDEETYKPLFFEDFIQSIQQPKYPVDFECEMEYKDMVGYWYKVDEITKEAVNRFDLETRPKTTTNSQGQTVLVGTYKYE